MNEYAFNNCYEIKTPFPANIFFQDIVYIDDNNKTSMELARKEHVKYFKCKSVYQNPDYPDTNIVIARIKNSEKDLWKNIMKNMFITANKRNYIKTCKFLYDHFKDKIIVEDGQNESS